MIIIEQIYKSVINRLITEKLLNRDIESRLKTDKSYNPIALDFYNFLKTRNITYEFYHGTNEIAYECMKKAGYIISPAFRGSEKFELRKEIEANGPQSYEESSGLRQIFFTTSYDYAAGYAQREAFKFYDGSDYTIDGESYIDFIRNKYNISDDFIKNNNRPLVLKVKIPLYLLTEIHKHIYDDNYRLEGGPATTFKKIILNDKLSNNDKLDQILKKIKNSKVDNEYTVVGLLPLSRINGTTFINKLDNKESIKLKLKHDYDIEEYELNHLNNKEKQKLLSKLNFSSMFKNISLYNDNFDIILNAIQKIGTIGWIPTYEVSDVQFNKLSNENKNKLINIVLDRNLTINSSLFKYMKLSDVETYIDKAFSRKEVKLLFNIDNKKYMNPLQISKYIDMLLNYHEMFKLDKPINRIIPGEVFNNWLSTNELKRSYINNLSKYDLIKYLDKKIHEEIIKYINLNKQKIFND